MSILTTRTARSRSYLRRRTVYDHLVAPPAPPPQPASRERHAHGPVDSAPAFPEPHNYERHYDISLGYGEAGRVINR